MKVTFLGGADEVGASSTLVEIAGKRLLIDAGIRISPRTSRGIQNSQLPDLQIITAAGGPDFILVTHAHTDHTGALPLVLEQYPHVPVFMTRPTQALVQTLQKDALNIMSSQYEQEGELPLFDLVAVEALMNAIQLVEFNQPIRLGEGLQVTYHVSGHIAGAGLLVLESSEGTLVMSGDVSMSEQRTVNSIQVPRIKADALVLESTYGGRLHAERRGEELRLIEMLKRITERGGKALIPAFALGRSQEVIQIILAYRDQLDAPVYVDGMVRSVCDSYNQFSDLLPQKTVRAAREEHLFFRQKIMPVRSRAEREQIAASSEPCIVVASSGMLTGGASVAYARHFAGDERNAILLTGYQDEEAPGRFLQRMLRERQEGETPTLKLGDSQVKVRCEIDTYSLSAHADEMELVNIASALKAQEVMLVHGDHGARHSLATALRRRQITVTTPKIGTVREFQFQQKPWAIGAQIEKGHQTGAVDISKLWESLKSQAGNFFSARELAQVWWGDGERAAEIQSQMDKPDNVYFSADWRSKSSFRVNSEEQVKRKLYQRAIMLANPDIVGKLIVMRDSNDQPRLAVVHAADIDSFEAAVQGTKGSHHPADALVWVIGSWAGYGEDKGIKSQLADFSKDARAHIDTILPFDKRRQLVASEQTVDPTSLMPETLPDGITPLMALTAIVLKLAEDGAVTEQGGLKPQRALEHGPMEQNDARELAMNAFPVEARMRKVGMDVNRKRLLLTFDFPASAQRLYAQQIEAIIDQTGWAVDVRQTVNQQALSAALTELMPEGAYIIKGPSFYMDKNEVQAELGSMEDAAALQRAYQELTGFKLILGDVTPASGDHSVPVGTPETSEQMEINAAYGVIRQALGPLGLMKTGLKQNEIVLTFISPQIGQRHQTIISQIANETGYILRVHPHPNQQQILQIADSLAREAGWRVRKGPGIHTDRAAVSLTLAEAPSDDQVEVVNTKLLDQTGYQFELS